MNLTFCFQINDFLKFLCYIRNSFHWWHTMCQVLYLLAQQWTHHCFSIKTKFVMIWKSRHSIFTFLKPLPLNFLMPLPRAKTISLFMLRTLSSQEPCMLLSFINEAERRFGLLILYRKQKVTEIELQKYPNQNIKIKHCKSI